MLLLGLLQPSTPAEWVVARAAVTSVAFVLFCHAGHSTETFLTYETGRWVL